MSENTGPDFDWTGRDDGPGTEFDRYYRLFQDSDHPADFTLMGFACDVGVQQNQGRPGPAEGPDSIRSALANMVPHHRKHLQDAGNISCTDGELSRAHQRLADTVSAALAAGSTALVLGGGHEVAFGSYSGLLQEQQRRGGHERIGIINFDALFDLRADQTPSSGTPFLQAARASANAGVDFNYLVLGIAEHANTAALFDTAAELGVRYLLDRELSAAESQLEHAKETLNQFLASIDVLYVSVDMDVFPAAVAPGVSAPAPRGVELAVVEPLLEHILATGKVKVFDVAETNPRIDIDNRTSQLAALLVHTVISHR
ncbi:formimidoylglutamase [Micrococcoides hystricis]|uniref:Formimidoylglutamase n=1 Tax=Micrococcoides hystricis TaxID=1572761 RepID=A0ABV6P9K9_9MICC